MKTILIPISKEEYLESDAKCSYSWEQVPNDYYKEVPEEEYPFKGFWKRLKAFIEDVETSDCPGEEEKEMILHVCKERIEQ